MVNYCILDKVQGSKNGQMSNGIITSRHYNSVFWSLYQYISIRTWHRGKDLPFVLGAFCLDLRFDRTIFEHSTKAVVVAQYATNPELKPHKWNTDIVHWEGAVQVMHTAHIPSICLILLCIWCLLWNVTSSKCSKYIRVQVLT